MVDTQEGSSTLASDSERIARLEGQIDADIRSPTRKISQWFGLVALIISIAVGGFEVYENVVLRERAAVASDRNVLAEYIRKITELNSKNASLYFSAQNISMVNAVVKIQNLEKVSVLGLADRILSDRPEIASFASLFVLSSEHLNLGNTVQAHEYANLAFSLAATDIEKVEARRLVARTLFAPGKGQDILNARSNFRQAVDEIRMIGTFLKNELFSDVYIDWILVEGAFGRCEIAKEAWETFIADIGDTGSSSQIVQLAKDEISKAWSSSRHCPSL